jgi:hypothetical protein
MSPLQLAIETLSMIIYETGKRISVQLHHIIGLGIWCLMPLSTIFQLYLTVGFIGGGKPPTNFYHKMLYRVHIVMSSIQTHNVGH